MKILMINGYFHPENFAFNHLEWDVVEGLVKAGHEVRVVCPVPTRGIPRQIAKEYKYKRRENYNGVEVYRFWAPQEGKNPLMRAIRYYWCNIRGNMLGKKFTDTDLTFANSTPPTQGLFIGKLSKELNVPFVYTLQDVFPDSLVTTGLASRKSILFKIGKQVERRTYEMCSRIVVLSNSVYNNLLGKGVDEKRLLTIGNWIDTEKVVPIPKEDNPLFEQLAVDREKFNVVYAGNLGASQGVKVIVEAAKLLKQNDEIRFVIIGSGSEYMNLMSYISQNDLENVTFAPLLPIDMVPYVYSLGDTTLISCKKGVGQIALPSKLWSILACNSPIIASFDIGSDLNKVLDEAEAGVCVEPENPMALAAEIKNSWKMWKENGGKLQTNSREYVLHHASKEHCVRMYVRCMEEAYRNFGKETSEDFVEELEDNENRGD